MSTPEEEYYAAHRAMLERLKREGSPPPGPRRVQSEPRPRVDTSVGSARSSTRTFTQAGTSATSRDVTMNHSIAAERSSSSARLPAKSITPPLEKRPRESGSEKEAPRGGGRSDPKRRASLEAVEPRKRPRMDEAPPVVASSDVSMGTEDISMFTDDDLASMPPPATKSSKGDAAKSSDPPADRKPTKNVAAASSSHAVAAQRTTKPLKLVPITSSESMTQVVSPKEAVSDPRRKSKAVPVRLASFPNSNTEPSSSSITRKPPVRSATVDGSKPKVAAASTSKAFSSKNVVKVKPAKPTSGGTAVSKYAAATQAVQRGIMPKDRKVAKKWTADEYIDDLFQKKDAGKLPMPNPPFFLGMEVFYLPIGQDVLRDIDMKRYERLVSRGAVLQRRYDPTTATHIVSENGAKVTATRLGINSVLDIPEHIRTVNGAFLGHLVSCYGSGTHVRTLPNGRKDYENAHWPGREDFDDPKLAAFTERIKKIEEIPVAPPPQVRRRHGERRLSSPQPPARSDTEDEDEDPRFKRNPTKSRQLPTPSQSSDIISRSSSPGLPPTSSPTPYDDEKADSDPLAEFYSKAREEAELGLNDESEFVDYTNHGHKRGVRTITHTPPSVWSVDNPRPTASCLNQDIIDELERLHLIHSSRPFEEDAWRAFSYKKCIRNIKNHPIRIKNGNEARQIYGVGEKTASKINEFLTTGKISRITHELSKGDVAAVKLFTGIYGVGSHTAYNWYTLGLRTLEDVRRGKGGVKLSPCQETGLKFYDDINLRMPRAEAEEIFLMIKPIALAIDPKLSVDIMGSFRRGKADCGDIDILITRPIHDGKTHAGVMARLWAGLHKARILTEDLALPSNMEDSLECTYRGLCSLPVPDSRRRRIDILMLPWQYRGAALLYYTGDDIFNRAMRFKAGKMGYSLNQRGLYAGVVRNPNKRTEKTNQGNIVASETEEEIFKILGVPWQEPWQRVRGA